MLEPIANALPVLPLSIAHVKLPVSPVAAIVARTVFPTDVSSSIAKALSVTVTASFVTEIVNTVDASLPSLLSALIVTVQD